MLDVLLVAATERELDGREGLVCGVGPVEAAVATARALALQPWKAVLHVGVAGGRGLELGTLVVGSEARYCDLSAGIAVVDRISADPVLARVAHAALPGTMILPIGTSAAVGSVPRDVTVEAMEGFGVLRGAASAGVPALEVRAISNEIGEPDRARWRLAEAIAVLSDAVPVLLQAITAAVRA